MKIKNLVHLKGEVLIQSVDNSGTISTIIEDKNLIVSNGRNNICNFLTNTNGSSYIFDIAFGTGGTITGNQSVALSVSPSEVSVIAPITGLVNGKDYIFTATAETAPSPRAVFSITIPAASLPGVVPSGYITALNGQSLSELALMLNPASPSAFAIKRFPSISKSSTISLIITWTIFV